MTTVSDALRSRSRDMLPPQIHHVGVLAQDGDAVVTFLRDAFGLEVVETIVDADAPMRAVMLAGGEMQIEVVERGDADARRAVLDGAPARLDHLAFAVPDLELAIAGLRALGAETESPGPIEMGNVRTIFLRGDAGAGVRYQLLEGRR